MIAIVANIYEVVPPGRVVSPVKETLDDVWGGVISRIELDASQFTPECLAGLHEFSHVEIVFLFDRVEKSEIAVGARHPRGRPDWPLVGIFAQRAKNRPNRIGATACRLISVNDLSLMVEGLDAIDGTPVLDVKPCMREFAPKGEVRQPARATELMALIGILETTAQRGNVSCDWRFDDRPEVIHGGWIATLAVLLGVLVNVGYFVAISGRMTRIEDRLDNVMGALSALDRRVILIGVKLGIAPE